MKLRASLYMAVAAVVVLLMPSCYYKELPLTPDGDAFTLQLTVEGNNNITTRAATDPTDVTVDDLALWMFDANDECIYFCYVKAADQTTEEQKDWKSGMFSVTLKGLTQDTKTTTTYVVANAKENLVTFPIFSSEIGKKKTAVEAALTLKPSSQSKLITTPLPMFGIATATSPTKSVTLKRAVARVKVDVKVDNTVLGGKLHLNEAKVTLGNLTAQGTALVNHSTTAPTKTVATDCDEYATSANVAFYSTPFRSLTYDAGTGTASTDNPIYLNQRGAATFTDNNATGRTTTVTLQVPYEDANGDKNENNYYQVEIFNTYLAAADKYHILPNCSYNLTLTIIGYGSEEDELDFYKNVKVETDVKIWSTQEIDGDNKAPFLNVSEMETDVYGTAPTRLHFWTNKQPKEKVYVEAQGKDGSADITVDAVFDRLSGKDAANLVYDPDTGEGYVDIALKTAAIVKNNYKIHLNASGLRREITVATWPGGAADRIAISGSGDAT